MWKWCLSCFSCSATHFLWEYPENCLILIGVLQTPTYSCQYRDIHLNTYVHNSVIIFFQRSFAYVICSFFNIYCCLTVFQCQFNFPLTCNAVLPDFTQVYRFIGSVFDPNVTGHLQKLKKMDPLDVETVCVCVISCFELP